MKSVPIIGLKRGIVKLLPYNLKWVKIFEKEKLLINKTFGKTIIAIEHVGSTSILGIHAKPIIDINIGVKSLRIARDMKKKFAKLGYVHRPFKRGRTIEDLKAQELYVKGSEAERTHYAHVTVYQSDYWVSNLLFRDYLRKNRLRSKQYNTLKRKLSKQYAGNREKYTYGKSKFILETKNMANDSR